MKLTIQIETTSYTSLNDTKALAQMFIDKIEGRGASPSPSAPVTAMPTYLKRQATEAQLYAIRNAKESDLPSNWKRSEAKLLSLSFDQAAELVSIIKQNQHMIGNEWHISPSPSAEPLPSNDPMNDLVKPSIPVDAKTKLVSMMCSVKGCFKRSYSKGKCQRHYSQEYYAKKKARKEVSN